MEIKFITEGMACSKCEARVTERLSSMPGVSSVVATASDGAVVVNGENLNRDELAQAISEYIQLFDRLMKGYVSGELDARAIEREWFTQMRRAAVLI